MKIPLGGLTAGPRLALVVPIFSIIFLLCREIKVAGFGEEEIGLISVRL